MAERVNYQLTNEEVGKLEHAIRLAERPEVRQQAKAICMLHQGKHPSEGPEELAESLPTIYY